MILLSAAKLEPEGRAFHVHVLVTQGGEAEGAVRLRVLLVADANQALLEELHHRREHLFARQSGPGDVRRRPRPYCREHRGKCLHPIELVAVATRAPVGVIAVLLAAARIASGRLEVPFRIGTDPHVLPRGRNRQRANTLQVGRIAHGPAVGALVAEPERGHYAADAGTIVGDVMEAGGRG